MVARIGDNFELGNNIYGNFKLFVIRNTTTYLEFFVLLEQYNSGKTYGLYKQNGDLSTNILNIVENEKMKFIKETLKTL
jgi:hypothetical protein